MLFRNLGNGDQNQSISWQDLEFGAPTIIGYARLCSLALSQPSQFAESNIDELSLEARTILVAARDRGSLDIRASRESFDSADRFLAVCVEFELDRRLLFLQKENPKQTVKFLDGFRELCQFGLVIHHLQKDFSLSAAGFEVAANLNPQTVQDLMDFALEIEH